MNKLLLLTVIIVYSQLPAKCQEVQFETLDVILIEPTHVNRYYPESIISYIDYYEALLQELQTEVERMSGDLQEKLTKHKPKRKLKQSIAQLEYDIDRRALEIIEIESCRQKWEEVNKLYGKMELSTQFEEGKCYEIIGTDKNYTPNEYVVESQKEEFLYWEESLPTKEEIHEAKTIEVSPASTKWVKKKSDRNCLSSNPEDCLVWCLVQVPATYRTISKRTVYTCPEEFMFGENNCKRHRSIQSNRIREKKIKVIDISNDQEVIVVGVNVVNCN